MLKTPTKLLLVEDNPGDARLIGEMLRDTGGQQYKMMHVINLATGLSILAENDIDLVLLDLGLPDGQGLQTFERVVTESPGTTIVILTGLDDEELAAEAMRHGAQDYLVKGKFDGELLVRSMRYAIERKKAAVALSESEERYRCLIEETYDMIQSVKPDGSFEFVSRRWLDTLGYSRDELSRLKMSDVIHPDSHAHCQQLFRQVVDGETVRNIEAIFTSKAGDKIYVEGTAVPRYVGEQVVSTHGFFRDVTERKQAEQELRHSRAELAATFNAISDWVMLLDAKSMQVLSSNRAGEQLLGMEMDDIRGQSCCELVHGTRNPVVDCPSQRMLRTNQREVQELSLPDGRQLSIAVDPVHDESGNAVQLVHIARDVTERNRMQREAQRLDKLESLSQLAGGVAHDFNNLLTAVITNLSLAGEEVRRGEDVTASISGATEAAKRARSLTRQLLAFTKGGAPIKQAASVDELLRSAASFVLRGSSCIVRFDLQEGLWGAEIDANQISQVIENLVLNSDQAMPEGGTIDVRAKNVSVTKSSSSEHHQVPLGKYICLSITDHGTGMSEQILGKIFDPYFTTKEEGSGLGLAVVHTVIHQHAGHIMVDSKVGAGTTFTVYLPATDRPSAAIDTRLLDPVKGAGRILVMDDDLLVQQALERLLTRLGYSAEITADGSEAIHAYRWALESGAPFQAVLMDLTVPGGMGGVETVAKLRELDPDVTAIICSGYSHGEVLTNYEQYGFAGVAAKPFDLNEIATLLHNVIIKKNTNLSSKVRPNQRSENRPRVLYVDDDDLVRRAAKRDIENASGVEVTLAESAEAGLAAIDRQSFAMVFSDYLMPGMNGIELLERVREKTPDTVRILVSGKADLSTAIEVINRVGLFSFVLKPWDSSELRGLVTRALNHHRMATEHRALTNQLADKVTELGRLNATLESEVQHRTTNLLLGLIKALDLRDTETQSHSHRVALYSRRLAEQFGIYGPNLLDVERGALLHDVGKIGVSDSILLKPGSLTDNEWLEMRQHCRHGYHILEGVEFLDRARRLVLEHHERWDGKGYPQGLVGDAICVGARIFAIIDTYDAMTSNRPYRKALPHEAATEEIDRMQGTQFDPRIVEAWRSIPMADLQNLRARADSATVAR